MSLLLAVQTPTTTLVRDEEIPVESQAAPATVLTLDCAIPIDSGALLIRSESAPVEAGLRLTDSIDVLVDSGALLTKGEQVPVETGSFLFDGVQIPVESGDLLVRAEGIPVEALLIVDGTPECIPNNSVFDADVFDPDVFDAAVECIEQDRAIPIESGIALVRSEEIPIDSTAMVLLVRDENIPVESLLTVDGTPACNDVEGVFDGDVFDPEVFDAVVECEERDRAIPIESGIRLVRSEEIPIDSVAAAGALIRDEEIPIDAGGLLVRDEEIPVEHQPVFITLTQDEEIPIEALAALVRDEEIPIDNTAQPVFLIVRDEEIPVESLSQTIPFSFIGFLGSGAPWPPSWLTRPKLLADERHCGMVRFYGRSRQVVRRPKVPLPIVIGKPYRPKPVYRPAVVQATLITRQLSECLTIVGGKSTQKIGHDWKMIREADEREIMTIIQVL